MSDVDKNSAVRVLDKLPVFCLQITETRVRVPFFAKIRPLLPVSQSGARPPDPPRWPSTRPRPNSPRSSGVRAPGPPDAAGNVTGSPGWNRTPGSPGFNSGPRLAGGRPSHSPSRKPLPTTHSGLSPSSNRHRRLWKICGRANRAQVPTFPTRSSASVRQVISEVLFTTQIIGAKFPLR